MRSFIIALALIATAAAAQSEVSLIATVDRETVAIGDTILFVVHATASETTFFSPPGLLDLSPFEIRSHRIDSSARSLDMALELQILAPGRHLLPSFPIHYQTGTLIDVIRTDTFIIAVPGLEAEPDTELRPIRDILGPAPTATASWRPWILLAALLLLLTALLLYRLLRRKKGILTGLAPPGDPREVFRESLREFDRLVDADPPRMKEAFSLLVEALKRLILALDGVDLLVHTTTETLEHPAIVRWSRADHDAFRLILTRADLVKFARLTVARAEAIEARDAAERIAASRYAPHAAAPPAESAPHPEARR